MFDYIVISVNFTFGLLDCDLYIGDIVILWIVKPGFFSMHYNVTLARLKNVNRYIGNIVSSKIFISGFHCSKKSYKACPTENDWGNLHISS